MLGDLTNELIEYMIAEFKKEDNKKKIKDNILDPIVSYFHEKLWPYIIITCAIFVLLFVLLLSVLYFILNK